MTSELEIIPIIPIDPEDPEETLDAFQEVSTFISPSAITSTSQITINENELEIFPISTEPEQLGNPVKSTSSPKRKDQNLNQYNRKVILRTLQEFGPGREGYSQLDKKFPSIEREKISQFINQQASLGQFNVKEECLNAGVKEFINVESWVDILKSQNLNEESKSEIAMVLKAIAETESHPDASQTGGIDFRKLYRFLSEVMIGQPSCAPEGVTAEFLQEVFDDLMEEVKRDKETLTNIKESLQGNLRGKSLENPFQKSLDPFLLEEF